MTEVDWDEGSLLLLPKNDPDDFSLILSLSDGPNPHCLNSGTHTVTPQELPPLSDVPSYKA